MKSEDKARVKRLKREFPNNFRVCLTTDYVCMFPDFYCVDNHVKLMVVDEKYFTIGGTNMCEVLCADGSFTPPHHQNTGIPWVVMPSGSRDGDVIGRGPIAKEMRSYFHRLFSLLYEHYERGRDLQYDPDLYPPSDFYTPVKGELFFEAFETSPLKRHAREIRLIHGALGQKRNQITEAYCQLVASAKEEIQVGNLYFYPQSGLFEEFLDAASRGVSIQIVTNGLYEDNPLANDVFVWAHRVNYAPLYLGRTFGWGEESLARSLQPLNVDVYEFRVPSVLYHKKITTIDKRYSIVGSYNFGKRSEIDFELAVVIDSKELAEDLNEVFEIDRSLSERIDLEQSLDWYFDFYIDLKARMQRQFNHLV